MVDDMVLEPTHLISRALGVLEVVTKVEVPGGSCKDPRDLWAVGDRSSDRMLKLIGKVKVDLRRRKSRNEPREYF